MSIFSIFNPKPSGIKNEEKKQPNVIVRQNEIISAVVGYLKQFYGQKAFHDSIVVWTTNQENRVAIHDDGFLDDLCLALENANLHVIAKANILVEDDKPPENNNFHKALEGLFIEIRRTTVEAVSGKARITSVPGFGTLSQNEYVLDSTQKTVFHIGRGEIGKYGSYRVNDIVVKADETDPEQKVRNNNVSSVHADIVFRNNAFHLKAMPRGCRSTGGSATKIVRTHSKPFELEDTITLSPLHHGDLIELGKNVLLKFEVVTFHSA